MDGSEVVGTLGGMWPVDSWARWMAGSHYAETTIRLRRYHLAVFARNHPNVRRGGYVPRSATIQRELLGGTGTEHMTQRGRYQALPPAYTEWIGRQLAARVSG